LRDKENEVKVPICASIVQNTKTHQLHLQAALSWVSKDHSFLSAIRAFEILEFTLHYVNVDIGRHIIIKVA
jgi:hypothetical protein